MEERRSQFFGYLDSRHLEGPWERMLAPFAFYDAIYNVTICAPTNFVLDFTSVPRIPGAFLIAGASSKEESVPHDVGYRFGFLSRKQIDYIFYHAGVVRSSLRTNQKWLYRTGRSIRTGLMLGAVRVIGWNSYNSAPGCLDYRGLKKCKFFCKIDSTKCHNYYPNWRRCIQFGYHPEILLEHGG